LQLQKNKAGSFRKHPDLLFAKFNNHPGKFAEINNHTHPQGELRIIYTFFINRFPWHGKTRFTQHVRPASFDPKSTHQQNGNVKFKIITGSTIDE
jgi:hypothetical protein